MARAEYHLRASYGRYFALPFGLFWLFRSLAPAQAHAGAAAVLVNEFDAGKLEGFTDSLNRLTRYWPSGPFKIDDQKVAVLAHKRGLHFVVVRIFIAASDEKGPGFLPGLVFASKS